MRKRQSLRAAFAGAFRGISHVVRTERNAQIHAAATVVVVVTGLACRVAPAEWAVLMLAIGAVWTAELLNASVERLADATSPSFHPLVAQCKEAAAGGVVAAALAALAVAAAVFGPRLLH